VAETDIFAKWYAISFPWNSTANIQTAHMMSFLLLFDTCIFWNTHYFGSCVLTVHKHTYPREPKSIL
jgi:hypothetical protein